MGVSRGMKEAFFARNGCYDSSLEGRMADEEMEDRWRKGEGGVVVGVDPVGSVLAENGKGEVGMYAVVRRPTEFYRIALIQHPREKKADETFADLAPVPPIRRRSSFAHIPAIHRKGSATTSFLKF
jgi:hypothetical protein